MAGTGQGRLQSVDLVRGAVMVLMAIDHVRVYSGLPPGGPTLGIFFTRWVTHFCAPAFVFLAGTGALFHLRKLGSTARLSRFLLIRGAWLILLELTVIRLAWTFNGDFAHYLLAGVIWAIGWSMIVLAGLVRLPVGWVAAFGLIVVAGHNTLDPTAASIAQTMDETPPDWLAQILYFGGSIRLFGRGPLLVVLYSLVPWVAVMALGYCFGVVLSLDPDRRRGACLLIGAGATVLFLVLRGFDHYGDPRPWQGQPMPAPLAFLNPTKYPASLLFLLMTLGPTIALMPALERARGWAVDRLTVFGRVPLFYYLLHIPLIHALALVVSWIREGRVNPWLYANHPTLMPPAPEGYPWSLGLLYLVFGLAVILLYPTCRWYAGLKARSGSVWLSYL